MTKHSRVSGVYAITPEIEDTSELVKRGTAALVGGIRIIQYRNKTGSASLRREQCLALLERLRGVGGTLIVNDDINLAFDVQADGVHLGKDDESFADARHKLGDNKIIGVSCYNDFARARALQAAGADYIAFGSFFPSVTKPTAVGASIDLLVRAKAELKVPVVAIGGINKENAGDLINAGADAIAVLSALFLVDDVEQEAEFFSSLFADRHLQCQH
ncbi:MAG: thiamine phosphate synthase [Burkholderiales bacterium]|nr:thiamine phosphate synthase [Burkholderiales bacterium]